MKRLRHWLLCLLACLFCLPVSAGDEGSLTLAIFAYRSKEMLVQRYQPLADYLSSQLKTVRIELKVMDQPEIEEALNHNGVDLLLTNPAHYLVVRSRSSMAGVLATLVSMDGGMPSSSLGGVIVTRDDAFDIRQLSDLKGKRIAVPQGPFLLAGYMSQAYELQQAGLHMPDDVELIRVGEHDKVLEAVASGQADAGFLRAGIIEDRIAREGFDFSRLRVLNVQHIPSFPYRLSTRLYPEWPLIVMPHVDERLTRRIASAIFTLDADHSVSKAARIGGFSPPADYLPVEQLARALKAAPFDQPVAFSAADAWGRYKFYVLASAAVFCLILLVSLRLAAANRKLQQAKTEIENSAKALDRERQQLTTLIHTLPDLVWLKDPDGVYLDCNPRFEAFFGFPREKIVGRTDFDFVERSLAESFRINDKRAIEVGGPCINEEWVTFGSDGHRELLETTKTPMYDHAGNLIGVLGIGHDITERKHLLAELESYGKTLEQRVEERSRELLGMEQRASLILRTSAAGLYGVDIEGRIIFINPAACSMLGLSAEQAIGQNAHQLFHDRHQDGTPYPVETCSSLRRIREGEPFFVPDETYWRSDGQPLPVMFWVHPMVEEGRHVGAVVSFVDVSAQHQAQQAKDQALAAAEKLARMRSEFVANMSHEIRTPLNGILGFAEIGLRNLEDRKKVQNALVKVNTAGKHLLGVINDILDFSKIEAGKLRIEHTDLDLSACLRQALELVRDQAQGKGLSLSLDCAPDVPAHILGDPLRLQQVLLNLLSNAIKFTEQGEVRLVARYSGSSLKLDIRDTGIGMSNDQLSQVFDPFVQGDASSTRRYGGTGLGLSITRRLVELMGGQIGVSSQPGQGTVFTIELPCLAHEAMTQEVAADAVQVPLQGVRVLVAEDNPVGRELLLENLQLSGAEVLAVENGREAWEKVLEQGTTAFDVILMDIQMPVMGGYEATERILTLDPRLPIIGQTAHVYGEERDRCFASGMVAHVAKPIDFPALTALIHDHAERRRATLAQQRAGLGGCV